MAGANRQGPPAGPRDWPRVGKQPANHENHAVTLLEDIEAITSIVQTIHESEKQGVPLRVVSDLAASMKNFIAKTKDIKDLNILQTLKSIEDKINKQPQYPSSMQPHKTYAEIAAHAQRHQNATISASMEQGRREREVNIRINKDKYQGQEPLTGEILNKIKEVVGPCIAGEALALRRLPSGDLILQLASLEAKVYLEEHPEWLNAAVPGAKMHLKTYPVMVHGVKKAAVDTTNEQGAREALMQHNRTLHPGLRVCRVAWPKSAQLSGKTYGSMIVELASAAEANAVIEKGMVEGYDIKTCELFDRNCRVTQCFKCQKYGHTGKTCRNVTACGSCAGNHSSADCQEKGNPSMLYCVVCGKRGHEAWSTHCQVRKEQREKAKEAFLRKPVFYVVPQQSSNRVAAAPEPNSTEHWPQVSQPSSQESDMPDAFGVMINSQGARGGLMRPQRGRGRGNGRGAGSGRGVSKTKFNLTLPPTRPASAASTL